MSCQYILPFLRIFLPFLLFFVPFPPTTKPNHGPYLTSLF